MMYYNKRAWRKTQGKLGDALWKVADQTRDSVYRGYMREMLDYKMKAVHVIVFVGLVLVIAVGLYHSYSFKTMSSFLGLLFLTDAFGWLYYALRHQDYTQWNADILPYRAEQE